jgi:hypothetical protein
LHQYNKSKVIFKSILYRAFCWKISSQSLEKLTGNNLMTFFVRSLKSSEVMALRNLSETIPRNSATFVQIQAILLSSQRYTSGEIAQRLAIPQQKVMNFIKLFNRTGFTSVHSPYTETPKDRRDYRKFNYRARLVSNNLPQSQYSLGTSSKKSIATKYADRLECIDRSIAQLVADKLNSPDDYQDMLEFTSSFLRDCTAQNAFLDQDYLYIYLAAFTLPTKNNVEKETNPFILAALGVKTNGERVPLGFSEGSKLEQEWLNFLLDLKVRGVRKANLWIINTSEVLAKALESVFPEQLHSYCRYSVEETLLQYVLLSNQKDIIQKVRLIYREPTFESAQQELIKIISLLKESNPGVAAFLHSQMDLLINFYRMPPEHWHYLKSTNSLQLIFNYLKRWQPLILLMAGEKKTIPFCYAILDALPHRRLKVSQTAS